MEGKQKKYQKLIDYIDNLIREGKLEPGDKLYSENELSEMFHISRQTVRKALGFLEEQGVVRRVRGSGTYISYDRRENLERCNRIAVITTYVDSYIFPKIIQGIENVLFERGYSVQISFTNNSLERERSVLEDMIHREDVAGIIVEGTKSGLPNPNIHLYRQLLRRKVPILFLNTYYPELDVPHVSLNDTEAAKAAVNYLIGRGHKNIGAVLKLDDGQGRLRYLGYLKALKRAGHQVTDSRVVWIDTEEARQLNCCVDKMQSRLQECSALFCYNDQIAFQLIQLLTGQGMRIPQDVSVISIDDSDLALHSEVAITSLPHPKERLGAKAAQILLEMLETNKKGETFEFETRVVERDSVADYGAYVGAVFQKEAKGESKEALHVRTLPIKKGSAETRENERRYQKSN